MTASQSTLDILNELAETSSKNDKIAILQRERQNKILRMVFYYALNPYIRYHIKQIPEYQTGVEGDGIMTLYNALSSLYTLYDRKRTGHKAQEWLMLTLEGLANEDAQVLERIIERDLKCGVGIKTVNMVWPGLIPEFHNMLAEPMRDDTVKNLEWPVYAQTKMDGQRVNIIVDNSGNMSVRTRNGKVLEGLENHFALPHTISGFVLDGEMLVLDDNGEPMERKKSNGIMNKVQKGTATEKEMNRVVAFIWDIIAFNEFQNGESQEGYSNRLKKLDKVISQIHNSNIRMVETHTVESMYEAKKLFEKALNRGEEGLVLKNREHRWKDGRSSDWIKMKAEKTAEFKIIDIEEGKGRHEGRLGNFIVSTDDGGIESSVGSGFSDEERDEYFTKKMIDKIVEVRYNEVICKDGDDVKSLYLPIFVKIRDDKDKANSTGEVV